jgi:hypothetical protein
MNSPTSLKAPSASALGSRLLADFTVFLRMVWAHLKLPAPTPIQLDIARALQHGSKRMVIEAFRGVGKSWITSAFVCWLLLVNPQFKILVVSASKGRADDFSIFTKRLIAEMPVLAHLRPREGQRDSNISFDVGPADAAHAPSVKSLGITSQLTGSRADIIIPDDIEVPNNSATQVMREKLANAVKEFEALLTPKPTSRIIFLGTPQCEMSIYNELANRGYSLMVWPARYPSETQRAMYGSRLATYIADLLDADPELAGKATDPARFGELDLMERELSYGRAGFALQFMLDTTLSDANRYPLRLSDLVVMDVAGDVGPVNLAWGSTPELTLNDLPSVGLAGDRYFRPFWMAQDMAPWAGTAMAIDPSGRGGDELSYAVGHVLHSRIFVPAWTGLPGGYSEENLERLVGVMRRYAVKHVIVESNFGDGMFTELLKSACTKYGYPVTIEEVRHNVQKERRICDTLEPVMNQHRLIVDKRLVESDFRSTDEAQKRSFYQMSRITRDKGALKWDDRIDVLAMLTAYWVDHLGQDTTAAAEAWRSEALAQELKSFEDYVFERSGGENLNWNQYCIDR